MREEMCESLAGRIVGADFDQKPRMGTRRWSCLVLQVSLGLPPGLSCHIATDTSVQGPLPKLAG